MNVGMHPPRERKREAWIRSGRFLYFEVARLREDGAFDYFTSHWTRRGAQKAVDLYIKTGEVKGFPL